MLIKAEEIIHTYPPFRNPNSIKGLMIGNDIDALLSAAFLHDRFGWPIVAFYNYHNIWISNNIQPDDLRNMFHESVILAVDLDIYHPLIPSIGHHILTRTSSEFLPGLKLSLNPNLLRGINLTTFQRKYPMATVHFLMWLFQTYPQQISREIELLLWLVDSTFINAQSHRFRKNVSDWLNTFIQNKILFDGFGQVDSKDFEHDMSQILMPQLNHSGIKQGQCHVVSRHLGLGGFQGQWSSPVESSQIIRNFLNVFCEKIGWTTPLLTSFDLAFTGKRGLKPVSIIKNSLKDFLKENKVFSYAFTGKSLLNYTTGIDI